MVLLHHSWERLFSRTEIPRLVEWLQILTVLDLGHVDEKEEDKTQRSRRHTKQRIYAQALSSTQYVKFHSITRLKRLGLRPSRFYFFGNLDRVVFDEIEVTLSNFMDILDQTVVGSTFLREVWWISLLHCRPQGSTKPPPVKIRTTTVSSFPASWRSFEL